MPLTKIPINIVPGPNSFKNNAVGHNIMPSMKQ